MMKNRRRKSSDVSSAPRIPAAERLLVELVPELTATRVLCTSLSRGQFAKEFAAAHAEAHVHCHFFDVYLADEARSLLGKKHANVEVACAADFPADEFDLVAIPVHTSGDAELTRELLQAGHIALGLGGRIVASTKNRDDQWLHAELRKLFPKVTRRQLKAGTVYLATKTAALKKVKHFDCEFAFRDGGRLIKAVSRPGVFSHRSLDAGARALLSTMDVRAGNRVLDVGCGSGAVGLAAALRAENVTVVAADSHARAVECTLHGAALNGLSNVTAVLDATGNSVESASFHLAVGNPPYYSDFRIAEIFLLTAHRALKRGGRAVMVTQHAGWFQQRMNELFTEVRCIPYKAYTVVTATKK